VTIRRVASLVAAIVLLGVVAIALVWWLDRVASGPRGSRDEAAAGAAGPTFERGAPDPGALAATVPAVEPASAAVPPPPPAGVRVTRSAPAAAEWKDVPIATRFSDLGPGTARPVYDGLRAAAAQMDTCFAREQARATGADPNAGYQGPAVLVLRMESRENGLDVVDTELESRGTTSADAVACVRTVLRSWPIPAPGATAGKRFRLRYPVPQ
jgi:hypothetical protein